MFKLRQDVYHAQTRRALLDNTLTVKIGDVIVPLATTNSVVTNATGNVAGDKYVLGVVVGFSKQNGEVIGTGTDPANTPGQLVTAADNTTNAKYYAVYVPITPEMEFSATLSAVAATTTNSDGVFVWFNLTDARTVNEASVVQYGDGTAPLQLFSFGLDPEDTANKTIICRFAKAAMYRP